MVVESLSHHISFEHVLTKKNYEHMIIMAKLFEAGVRAVIDDFKLEWDWYRMQARIPIMPTTGSKVYEDFHNIELHNPIHTFPDEQGCYNCYFP